MHKQFRKLLEKATGKSQYVIAIVLDVRWFTPFCQTVDSVEVATYVKKIYMKIIDNYFSNASFYKPTGDGLLVVIPYDEESLKEVVNSTMWSCLKLLEDFGSLCIGDAMINFPTPDKIGIGMTRGSACCITSEERILDYSGKMLNLASRLMDMARPSGIVFDSGLGLELLSDEKQALFLKEAVYVRGVAEEKPIDVYYSKEYTILSDLYKKPLKEPQWKEVSKTLSFEQFKRLAAKNMYLILTLEEKPLDEKQIAITVRHQMPKETLNLFWDTTEKKYIVYEQKGKKYLIKLDLIAILKDLEEQGAEEGDTVFEVDYPVA